MGTAEMSLRDELIGLERRFWESAGNPDFYQDRFADDGVMAFHVGVMTKPDVVASMVGSPEWASYTIDDPVVIAISDDVASLTYTTTALPQDSDEGYRAALTSVYARRDGEWVLVLHQQTPLAM
jgi:hypothetical protein